MVTLGITTLIASEHDILRIDVTNFMRGLKKKGKLISLLCLPLRG